MNTRRLEMATSCLVFNESSRLQCLHGCKNYKRSPLCPPSCPDYGWFQNLIQSYNNVIVYYEVIEYVDRYDLIRKKNQFQTELLSEEQNLKKQGNCFAISFVSGACTMCENKECILDECTQPLIGRMPICATGIDLNQLNSVLKEIPQKIFSTFWKLNLPIDYFEDGNKFCCIALLLF